MGWILLCLLWVTMTTTSAYNYRDHPYAFYDYPHERVQTRRIDYGPAHPDYSSYNEQLQERSAERTNARPVLRTNERPAQRMNERSIAVTSGIQRVQENERIRVQSWVEESAPRSENGSYKIVNRPIKYPSVPTRRGTLEDKSSDSVVFPGRTSAQRFIPEIPNECEDLGICETIPNYPQELVDNIISKLGDKLDRFKVDELEEPEIAQRIGPDDNPEIDLCNFREKIIKPQAAKDKRGDWYVILNSKDNPLQGYRVEICHSKGQACAENIAYFSAGYTPVCKQKYVQRMMTAVDVERKEVLYDMPFRVPSCCSCVAIHNKN